MASDSEDTINNPSEGLPSGDRMISLPLTSPMIGLTYGITYDAISTTRPQSPLAPSGLTFPTTGMSNGYASRVNGITDFTAYNDYIHYLPVGNSVSNSLNNAGISNASQGGGTRFNVYNHLVRASSRFEIYSRQYRV